MDSIIEPPGEVPSRPGTSSVRPWAVVTVLAFAVVATTAVARYAGTPDTDANAAAVSRTSSAAPPLSAPASAGQCALPGAATAAELAQMAGQIDDVTTVQYPAHAPSAREPLTALAAAIVANGCDAGDGSVQYTRVRQWADASTTTLLSCYQQWRAPDGSGPWTETRQVGPDQQPETTSGHAAPGGLDDPMLAPLAPDAAGLAAQFVRTGGAIPQTEQQAMVNGVTELYMRGAPDLDLRRQLLLVLADTETLRWRGKARDRAGRKGVAVSLDTFGRQLLLILHPVDGTLLAFQSQDTDNSSRRNRALPDIGDYRLFHTDAHAAPPQPVPTASR